MTEVTFTSVVDPDGDETVEVHDADIVEEPREITDSE